jgi:hypothetical protein
MAMTCLDVFNASNLVATNQDTILAADIPAFYDLTSYIGDSTLAGKQASPPTLRRHRYRYRHARLRLLPQERTE